MVRFFDAEVYTINKQNINRNELLNFFLNGHTEDIVLVYSSCGDFYGIINYMDLLLNNNIEDAIFKEKLIFDNNVFGNANQIFNKYKSDKILIPVFNILGELDCFCYNDTGANYSMYFRLCNLFINLPTNCNLLKYVNDDIEIACIYDLNELSFNLYKVLEKHKIPTYLSGEKWGFLTKKENCNEKDYADYSKLYIYAEGTELVRGKNRKPVNKCFEFLKKIGMKLGAISILNWLNNSQNISKYLLEFPTLTNTIELSLEEMIASKIEYLLYKLSTNKLSKQQMKVCNKLIGNEVVDYIINDNQIEPLCNEFVVWKGRILLGRAFEYHKNRLYLIGPCVVQGMYTTEETMLAKRIQEKVRKFDYMVVRIVIAQELWYYLKEELLNIPIHENDIVMFCGGINMFEYVHENKNTHKIQLIDLFKTKRENESWFVNYPIHLIDKGCQVVSDYIYENYLKSVLENSINIQYNHYIQIGNSIGQEEKQEIFNYLQNIPKKQMLCGAIVMNCNPFTLGHKYLIEYAASKVEFLYVFVVEEDKSYFKFEDRINMVKNGTKNLDNILILPSGEFILSYKTLPSYFEKEEQKEAKISASLDIEIFARYIAPALNIKYRFAGEEPIDKVTKQYN